MAESKAWATRFPGMPFRLLMAKINDVGLTPLEQIRVGMMSDEDRKKFWGEKGMADWVLMLNDMLKPVRTGIEDLGGLGRFSEATKP